MVDAHELKRRGAARELIDRDDTHARRVCHPATRRAAPAPGGPTPTGTNDAPRSRAAPTIGSAPRPDRCGDATAARRSRPDGHTPPPAGTAAASATRPPPTRRRSARTNTHASASRASPTARTRATRARERPNPPHRPERHPLWTPPDPSPPTRARNAGAGTCEADHRSNRAPFPHPLRFGICLISTCQCQDFTPSHRP